MKKSVNVVGSVSNKESHWKQPFQSRSMNLLFGHWVKKPKVKKPKVKKPSKPPAKLSTFAMLPLVTLEKATVQTRKERSFPPSRCNLLLTADLPPPNTPVFPS